ncbi:hypothetical protein LJC26_02375, partial [Desulfovibrio sp. OttesenSCG-928-O18]|nr:hypothetical protein [Desulfovibrio sp. OttesenSCG-928-O18]
PLQRHPGPVFRPEFFPGGIKTVFPEKINTNMHFFRKKTRRLFTNEAMSAGYVPRSFRATPAAVTLNPPPSRT